MINLKSKLLLLSVCLVFSIQAQNKMNKKVVFFKFLKTQELDTTLTYGYIDSNNTVQVSEELINLIHFKDGLSPIFCEGKYGFINEKFQIVISCKYNYVNLFYNNLSLVKFNEYLYLITKSDSIVRKLDYRLPNFARVFRPQSNWIIFIKKNFEKFQIDTNYNITLLDENYDIVDIQTDDYEKNANFDLTNVKQVLRVDSCFYCPRNSVLFKKNGLIGIADTNGNIISPPIYDWLLVPSNYSLDLFIVKTKSKTGVFLKSFLLIDTIFDDIIYNRDYYSVKKGGKYSLLNRKGAFIIPELFFDYCYMSSEGIITAIHQNEDSTKGKIEYFNQYGEQISTLKFEDGEEFHEGLCPIKISGKWGFINTNGDLAVKVIYDTVSFFKNDRAFVKYKGKWGLIDQYGIAITDFKYDEIKIFSEGYAAVCINNKWGYINKNGQEVTAIIFDYCSNIENGIGYVDIRGKYSEIKIEDLISNY
jgi:hypothetical protein